MSKKEEDAQSVNQRLERLVDTLEAMGIDEYVKRRSNPRKMLLNSALIGLAKGFGSAVGFTILGALVIYILRNIAMANLPVIGDFIAKIVNIVDGKLG